MVFSALLIALPKEFSDTEKRVQKSSSRRRSFSALSRKVSGNCLECFEDVETAFMPFNSFCVFLLSLHVMHSGNSRLETVPSGRFMRSQDVHGISSVPSHRHHPSRPLGEMKSPSSLRLELLELSSGGENCMNRIKKFLKIHSFEERSPQAQWDSRLPHRVKQMKMPEVAKRFFEA